MHWQKKTRFEELQKRMAAPKEEPKARTHPGIEGLNPKKSEEAEELKTIKGYLLYTTASFRADMKALTDRHQIRYGGNKLMAQNSLVKQNADKVVEYECNGNKVKLTPNIIRQYLVSGGGDVSDQEIVMFLNLCRYQKLNPFLREAYLIKFGNNPASMVTGKEVFTKRANRNKEYAGQQAGVVVQKRFRRNRKQNRRFGVE